MSPLKNNAPQPPKFIPESVDITNELVVASPQGFPEEFIRVTLKKSAAKISLTYNAEVPSNMRGSVGKVVAASLPFDADSEKLVVKYNIDDRNFSSFLQEAQTHVSLKHKNIVPCLGFCTLAHPQKTLTLMPCIDDNLFTRVCANGRLSWATILNISQQIAEGLAHIHHQGIVHRDITQRNILLAPDDHAYICDFGRALKVGTPNPNSFCEGAPITTFCGNKVNVPLQSGDLQLAPELFYAPHTTFASDIFGWGALTLIMLRCDNKWVTWTNEPECSFKHQCPKNCIHYAHTDHQTLADLRSCNSDSATFKLRIKDSSDLIREQSSKLAQLAGECLELPPQQRPQDMKEICDRIQQFKVTQ